VTKDSLIVSGETLRGYYIFQLAECGPDYPLRNRLTDRSGGVERNSQLPLPFPNGSLEKPLRTYEYWKYVIDPMCRYQ
jgi:hypothetical protein